MNEEIIRLKTKDGNELSAVFTTPTIKNNCSIVISCHGFGSGKNNKTNGLLNPALTSAGIAFFRFDFRGHYESSGDIEDVTISSCLLDLNTVFEYVQSLKFINKNRIGIFSTSFGSSVALLFNSKTDKISTHVMKAPIVDYIEVRNKQLGEFGISLWEKDGFTYIDSSADKIKSNYDFYLDAKRIDLYKAALKINSNCLIFHNLNDDNVPVNQSLKLSTIIPNCILELSEYGNHNFNAPGQLNNLVNRSVQYFLNNL